MVFDIRNLRKSYGKSEILRGLSWQIAVSESVGLIGRNGAGKTTLFEVLTGLLVATSGQVRLLGHDPVQNAECRADLVYVPDLDLTPPSLSIAELLKFEATCRRIFCKDEIGAWLSANGIATSRLVSTLSKGQNKRFQIELALASKPSVLLMDEPFAGLDPVAKDETFARLTSAMADGPLTLLVSSHSLSDVERLCERVCVLAGGVIAEDRKMDDLKESTGRSLESLGAELIRQSEAQAS